MTKYGWNLIEIYPKRQGQPYPSNNHQNIIPPNFRVKKENSNLTLKRDIFECRHITTKFLIDPQWFKNYDFSDKDKLSNELNGSGISDRIVAILFNVLHGLNPPESNKEFSHVEFGQRLKKEFTLLKDNESVTIWWLSPTHALIMRLIKKIDENGQIKHVIIIMDPNNSQHTRVFYDTIDASKQIEQLKVSDILTKRQSDVYFRNGALNQFLVVRNNNFECFLNDNPANLPHNMPLSDMVNILLGYSTVYPKITSHVCELVMNSLGDLSENDKNLLFKWNLLDYNKELYQINITLGRGYNTECINVVLNILSEPKNLSSVEQYIIYGITNDRFSLIEKNEIINACYANEYYHKLIKSLDPLINPQV